MWASNCVYFLSFLCPTQRPQSSALCSVPSWKFLFSGTRGAGPAVLGRSHSTGPHNGWAVLLYQHLFLSCFPPFFSATFITSLGANQQQEEQGCASLSLSVWDIAGSVLLSGVGHDSLWLCILCDRPAGQVYPFLCVPYSSCAFMRCRSDF